MKNFADSVIVCPKCKYEYHPAEIFIPDNFFGHPTYVQRNFEGNITGLVGKSSDNKETYECDNCHCVFTVKGKLTFDCYIDETLDLNNDYVTNL